MANEARRWLDQGMAAAQAGDRAAAEPLLMEAARLDPANPDVWLALGWVAATPQEALERIGRAVTLAPQDPRVQKAYAWAQSRLAAPRSFGERESGGAASREQRAAAPPSAPPPPDRSAPGATPIVSLRPAAAYEQGKALLEQDHPAQAIPYLQAAVQGDPTHADYHAALAVACYQADRADEAIAELQRAVELRPEFDEAYYSLGVIYRERGQEDEAIVALQRCLNLNPRHADARRDLAALTKQREERLFKEVRGYKEPPPANVPMRSESPPAPAEVKLVKEPVQRSFLPNVIAMLWGLWTAAYGLPLLCLLAVFVGMPGEILRRIEQQGSMPLGMASSLLSLVMFIALIVYGLPTLLGVLFIVGNLRRWPWVFYGNIIAAGLIMAWELCGLAVPLSSEPEVATSSGLAVLLGLGVCAGLPPFAVIALSFFARDDFRRQTVAVVPESEQLPLGDAADYYNRGLRRSKQGRIDQAVADFEEAVRLQPDDITYRNVLALAYAEQKRFAQALEQLEAALQIRPHDPMTQDNRRIVQDLQAKG